MAVGKLITAPAVFFASPSPTPSGASLIHLKDSRTHVAYLVNTGRPSAYFPSTHHFFQQDRQ